MEKTASHQRSKLVSPHVSRLCYLADALTFLRIITSGFIIGAILTGSLDVDVITVAFIIGELTDAFDGMCARTFLYPRDGKDRWWRNYAAIVDQVADLMLGIATIVYVGLFLDIYFAVITLLIGITFALPVQLLQSTLERVFGSKVKTTIILVRRALYVLAVVLAGFNLLFHTHWYRQLSPSWQMTTTYLIIVLLLLLLICKINRITEEKTPVRYPKHLRI